MFRPNLAGTRGKTVRQKLNIVLIDYVYVTWEPLKFHKFVTLMAYVMFVNGTIFFIDMPCGITFVPVEQVPTFMATKLSKYLKCL